MVERSIFWNKTIETLPVRDLKKLQLRLLRRTIERVYGNSPFYHRRLKASKTVPPRIRNLKDIERVPFTTREDLENNYEEILSVPRSQVATVRQTSGTTGKPLTVAHTRKDVDNIAEASARKLSYHGVTRKDVVQVTAPYGLWQGAWSAHWGAERIGASILPAGGGDSERQITLIKRFGSTVLYGVTNYHFRIAEVAKQLGENLARYSLRTGICVAENPSKSQITRLREELGYDLVAVDYGATEFPGFSVNCSSGDASHHAWSDFYLVEVVDPKTHEVLEDGERGELAITSLQREAYPLIRYLSRDITTLEAFEKCECGLTHPKIGAEIDREDFMTKVRGTSLFPSQVELVLEKAHAPPGRVQIIVDKRTPRQEATLRIETREDLSYGDQKSMKATFRDHIKNTIGVTIDNIEFVPFGTFADKVKKTVVIE